MDEDKSKDRERARKERFKELEKMNVKIDEKKYKQFVENVELLDLVLTRTIKKDDE